MGENLLETFREINAGLTAAGSPFALQDRDDPQRRHFSGTAPHVRALGDRARERFGPQEFITMYERVLTFEDVFVAADRLAGVLARTYGIKPGDRVGLAMRNLPEWFITFFAVVRLGGIITLLNSRGASEEICSAARFVDCGVVIADDARSGMLDGVMHCPVIGLEELGRITDAANAPPPEVAEPDADDPLFIIFTSGTTGRPKGATLTHRNICSVAREMELRAEAGLIQAARQAGVEVEALRAQMPPPAPTLLISPLFHISGVVGMLMSLNVGSPLIMVRRWNPVEALEIIDAKGVASLSGPSLVFADLLALPDAGHRMRSLRGCAVAGQATPARLAEELRENVPEIGVTSCWGQTELTGAATNGNGAIFAAIPGTVGLPTDLVEIKVADEEGNELPSGEVGELLVRGPTVMHGYWNDEKATSEAFRDGWLCSGDLGWADDDGLIYIADRAKDMVISAGQNIYCAEVERVLSMLNYQREVALFGVEDERLGERAIAAVVLRDDVTEALDAERVRAHVRAHLADYKVPPEVHFDLGPLPRNDLGKVDKAVLCRRYHERSRV